MKKITLLMMLFVASIGMNAQSWTFENTMDGWANIGATKKLNPTFLTLNAKEGAKNPNLSHNDAKVDADAYSIMAFTVQNHDANGPTYIRVSFSKGGGKYVYKGIDISNGDTEFKTYYVDLSNSNWTGTKNELKIQFKNGATVDFTGTVNLEQIDVDKIEMLDAIPTTEKHVFNFDTDDDSEGWVGVNSDISGPTSGVLTFIPVASKYAKLDQDMHYVVADDYNWLRVKMTNNSTGDNELLLITSLGRAHIDLTTSDATEQTYEILLDTIGVGGTGSSAWVGNAEDIVLRFGDATTGKSTGTGSFEINSIEFYQAPGLSNQDISKDDTQLSIYPNPVRNTLSVKASAKINSLQIYNVTGQEVLRSSEATINTSSLTRGVYILRVSQEGGAISTKRFIKE